jgi:hypothetical protein
MRFGTRRFRMEWGPADVRFTSESGRDVRFVP